MIYTLTGDILKQDAEMERPKTIVFERAGWYSINEAKEEHDLVNKYNAHIASLKSYPILPGSVWPKKERLVEGKDFRFHQEVKFGSTLPMYAVPIKAISLREEPQERVFTLEEMKECWAASSKHEHHYYMGLTGDSPPDEKEYFKTKFNIEL